MNVRPTVPDVPKVLEPTTVSGHPVFCPQSAGTR